MKFCYNVGENEDKSKQLCKFHENIFEKNACSWKTATCIFFIRTA